MHQSVGMTASGRILAAVFTFRDDAIRPDYRIYRATAPPMGWAGVLCIIFDLRGNC
jgi:hypothetical protein